MKAETAYKIQAQGRLLPFDPEHTYRNDYQRVFRNKTDYDILWQEKLYYKTFNHNHGIIWVERPKKI